MFLIGPRYIGSVSCCTHVYRRVYLKCRVYIMLLGTGGEGGGGEDFFEDAPLVEFRYLIRWLFYLSFKSITGPFISLSTQILTHSHDDDEVMLNVLICQFTY